MHFYCSNHRTIFCRECIQVDHTDEKCFVVDLYEIEKMRKLQGQNILLNKAQLSKRKDGATVSCVVVETYKPHERKKVASIKKVPLTQAPVVNSSSGHNHGKDIFDHGALLQQRLQQQIIGYEYEGNEELMTDEARTNEEEEEFLQKQQQLLMNGAHYNQQHMFFNDDEEEEE